MLLDELPVKTVHTLQRSITWTEVEVVSATQNPRRRLMRYLARPRRWALGVRLKVPNRWRRVLELRRRRPAPWLKQLRADKTRAPRRRH